MIRLYVEYEVKPDTLDACLAAIVEFVQAVNASEPNTKYEAFQKPDKVGFIHFMTFPDSTTQENHKSADYTKKFVEVLYSNCTKKPVFTEIKLLG